MDTTSALPQIDETLLATTRYLQALTLLDEPSVHRPSGLPGWTRAHVVAHVSRNADSFTRVLAQVAAGEAASMYPSAEERNAAIDETVATHDAAGLVADAIASAARLTDAFWECTADHATPYTRVPGGEEVFALDTLGPRRRLEVEVHHSDLETGYLPTEWPLDFTRHVVQMRARELGARLEHAAHGHRHRRHLVRGRRHRPAGRRCGRRPGLVAARPRRRTRADLLPR